MDTVLCLISGGGSALLCSPTEGVTLEEKIAATRFLSGRGAKIDELNSVRRAISNVKAGGLVSQCKAKQVVTLILSDVLGDQLRPLPRGNMHRHSNRLSSSAGNVTSVRCRSIESSKSIYDTIERKRSEGNTRSSLIGGLFPKRSMEVHNIVLANNATAVDAAGTEAVARGYAYWMESSRQSEGEAEAIGRKLAQQCMQLKDQPHINCLISGGEPTVALPLGKSGKGGRNQHLMLAALCEMQQCQDRSLLHRLVMLSAGTDGEDGPTDAAGAWIDLTVLDQAKSQGLNPQDSLQRCDAYHFFERTGSLIKTGLTNTNVCDLRVALFARE